MGLHGARRKKAYVVHLFAQQILQEVVQSEELLRKCRSGLRNSYMNATRTELYARMRLAMKSSGIDEELSEKGIKAFTR